jgi:hypothetical protein
MKGSGVDGLMDFLIGKKIQHLSKTAIFSLPLSHYRSNATRTVSLSRRTVSISNAQSGDDGRVVAHALHVLGGVELSQSLPVIAANQHDALEVSPDESR